MKLAWQELYKGVNILRLAKDYRTLARNVLQNHWGVAIAVSLVGSLLGAEGVGPSPYSFSSFSKRLDNTFDIRLSEYIAPIMTTIAVYITIISLALLFIGSAIILGMNYFNIQLLTNQKVSFSMLFDRFFVIEKAIELRLYTFMFTFFWSLLLLVPGIIAAYRYRLATYIMTEDPRVGIRQAVEISKNMMVGNKFRSFCLDCSFIGWGILCLLTAGIGYLWLIPYMHAAEAAFYLDVSGQYGRMFPQAQTWERQTEGPEVI